MTRETKIGLLVGLAFIIVIGILLSDHMSAEPPQAQLQGAGDNLRSGLGTPVGNGVGGQVVVGNNVAPNQPVPTRHDLTPPPPMDPPVTMARGPANPNNAVNNSNNIPNALRDAAHQRGEELVDPNTQSGNDNAINNNSNNTVAMVPVKGPTHYTAQAGDSVSRLAGRFLGGNTKANRDAIIAANPSLKDNPNRIVVGKSYTIPAARGATVELTSTANNHPSPAPTPRPETTSVYTYTVEAGDSLWSIADSQLGNGAAWAAIQELNKDALKGGKSVRAGMKLKLPAKPIASAD